MATDVSAITADGQTQGELPKRFGTFGGVFTPSILTILGVIMFMRADFVIGQAGILSALIILVIGKSITFATGLSISAIATNTEVRGGGAYFMISRTLGPEFGGSIGIALFLAQTLSVPFYILGFAEAVVLTLPLTQPYFFYICLITLIFLFVICWIGSEWAIKTQYIIMAILGLAIVFFMIGAYQHFDKPVMLANWKPAYTGSLSFWKVFAIYFPAVTGIMAGVNMSGNLKNPSRALPWGTMAAIFVGAAVYGAQIVLCGGAAERNVLIERPYQILLENAFLGRIGAPVVAAGVFAATLSSALGSLLGAPRILQAIGQDRILAPANLFSKLSKNGEPLRALWLVFIASGVVIYYSAGKNSANALNIVASIVTMLFLFTYGMTNLAAFVESYGRNPSFRPRFRLFHWSFALYGAVICIIAAFLIDPPATLGAVALLTLIYLYVRKFVLTSSFGDARRGFVYSRIRDNLFALAQLPLHPKNWRPTSLVLAGDAGERLTLVHYAVWMGSGRGIVLLVSILQGEFTEMLNERKKVLEGLGEFIEKNNLKAFPQVLVDNVFDHGLQSLLQSSSVGPLHPNMVVMGFPKDLSRAHMFVHHLNTAQSLGMSQILVYDAGVPVFKGRKKKLIDIWWRGMENGSLMLILAYLVSLNQEWTNTVLRIVRVISSNAEEPEDRGEMKRLVDSARIPAEILLVEGGGKPFNEILDAHSRHSTAIFLGFRIPAQSDAGSFLEYFAKVLRGLPTTIIVHSTGEADLTS